MGKKKYKCVVYRYINDADGGKSYVGYTIDEQVRRAQFQNLKYKYGGAKINAAREQFGPDAFRYERLYTQTCEEIQANLVHHLQQLEAENISKYDSFASGYNSNIGGAGLHGVKMSEDQKQLLRKSSRKCAVKLVPVNGEEPFTLESIIETSRFLGTNPGRVYSHIKSNQPLNGYKLEKVII